MSFMEAVRSVFTQYVGFSGRARRSEFWWYTLFYVLLGVVMNVVNRAMGSNVLGLLVGLAVILPSLAVGARRLHDTGRTGWWQLLGLTIVGFIVLIIFWVGDSQPGQNQYGPNPKGGAAAAPAA
jgi:uncharacterized membrane protein YhaH (DUF805 family)